MNDFEFILKDIIFKKDIQLSENDFYDIKLALSCASTLFEDSGTLEHRKKSRELLRLKDKLQRC